jgi:glycerophosphoryl diester phosphodiesterase
MKKRYILLSLLFLIVLQNNAQCTFHAIGHRGGASYYFPENTLLSIEQGFLEGAWAIECDPRMTKDSVLMLMHDDYIDRTTNGHGFIAEMTKAQIKQLDAGSWKDPKFAGNRVPTLLEAIKIAQKYNRKLYLNMKVYQPELIKKTLLESGAPDTIFMIDPDDTTKVREYHTLMPNTKLVYFGPPPTDIHDIAFYQNLKKQNVIAAEVPVIDIQDTANKWIANYRDMLHSIGLGLWTYTINGHELFEYARNFGIDGLETDRAAMAKSFFCEGKYGGFFPEKRITGQWDFNSQSLKGTIGSQMVLIGDTSKGIQTPLFRKTSDFSIPSIYGVDVPVAYIPALDSAHALRFFSNMAPIADSLWKYCDCNLDYTLIMDILKPASSQAYIALFQTGSANTDDAELFINANKNNGIGILDQYFGSIHDSVWYRLAFAFNLDSNKINVYSDGRFLGTVVVPEIYKYRFCINNNWAIQMSNLFSDESNETSSLYVNSVQIRDYTMTDAEIASLGKASAFKIPAIIAIDSSSCLAPIPIIADTTVVEGVRFTLSAFAGDTLNYKWQYNSHNGNGWQYFADTSFLNTANPLIQISSLSTAFDGLGLRCSISNDCKVVTNEAIVNVVKTHTNIAEKAENRIMLYPNPSAGELRISSSAMITSITVYSVLGQSVLSLHDVSKNEITINLPSGFYTVEVISTEAIQTVKVIVTQ